MKKKTFQMPSIAVLSHNSPKLTILTRVGGGTIKDCVIYMQMEPKRKFIMYNKANTVLY